MFQILIIFGSFAKEAEHKGSDVDLLIITPSREAGEEIERVISSESVFLKRAIHSIVLDEKEFLANLASKELNVVKEAFKNHIILSGIETFYQGVKLTR